MFLQEPSCSYKKSVFWYFIGTCAIWNYWLMQAVFSKNFVLLTPAAHCTLHTEP